MVIVSKLLKTSKQLLKIIQNLEQPNLTKLNSNPIIKSLINLKVLSGWIVLYFFTGQLCRVGSKT